MRTSLREIEQIEKYHLGELHPCDRLVHEARMLTEPCFNETVKLQLFLYRLLQIRRQKVLKEKLEAVHHEFFNGPANQSFRSEIESLFKS